MEFSFCSSASSAPVTRELSVLLELGRRIPIHPDCQLAAQLQFGSAASRPPDFRAPMVWRWPECNPVGILQIPAAYGRSIRDDWLAFGICEEDHHACRDVILDLSRTFLSFRSLP